jgi:hypothetical protein
MLNSSRAKLLGHKLALRLSAWLRRQAGCPASEPEYLYKYRPLSKEWLEFVLDILERDKIWFSAASKFNDPFDCLPVYNYAGTDDEIRARYAQRFRDNPAREKMVEQALLLRRDHPDKWEAQVDTMRAELGATISERTGVLSLSEVPDSLLMWGHYADCHTGVCLRFSRATFPALFKVAKPVRYSRDRPALDIIGDSLLEKVQKGLLTKAQDWDYEKEWRLVSLKSDKPNSGPGLHSLPPGAVDAIILGERISAENENRLRAASASKGITIFKARLHATKFSVEIDSA